MIPQFGDDTALILIDPQIGVDVLEHWGGPTGRKNNPDAAERIAEVLDAFRAAGRPVFYTQHDSREAASPLKLDLPTGAFIPALAPRADEEVVVKSVNGGFFGTDLELRMRRHGVRRLVVVGYFTNFCVETTVRSAGNLLYDTYLVPDACSTTNRVGPDGVDHDPEVVHQLAVATLHGEFCTALSVADTIALLGADAPHLDRVMGNE